MSVPTPLRRSVPELPGLPLVADLGVGDATFRFAMQGDQVRGLWSLRAPQVRWVANDAKASGQSDMMRYATQVIAGIPTLSGLSTSLGPEL